MRFDRRKMLGGLAGGFFGLATRRGRDQLFAESRKTQRRCLVLWMNGGPSQLETFDPKPGTATGGELGAIATNIPGLAISETLPGLAKRMQHLTVLRHVTSTEGEHERGQYYLHTGFPFVPGFPRPALGSVVSHEAPPADFPNYVSIGSPGYGPAYMGPRHAPFSIEDPREALELMTRIRRRSSRIELLRELGNAFDDQHTDEMLHRRRAMIGRIESLVTTKFVRALQLDEESEAQRQRYGDSEVGRHFLLARRLLETGVRFVEVQVDGWDTHVNNFRQTRQLCAAMDRPWSALLDDLAASGLLDETVVLWMGEFGRTPNINGQNGRDHFPAVTPVVIGGGSLQTGGVIGSTNRTGTEIVGDSVTVPDLFATVFSALGIEPSRQFTTGFNSPTGATDDGHVIDGVL